MSTKTRCRIFGHKPDEHPGMWSVEHQGYIAHGAKWRLWVGIGG